MMKKNKTKIGMQIIFDRSYVGCIHGTVLAVEEDRVRIRDDYGWDDYCRFDDIYANEKEYEKNPIISLTITRNQLKMLVTL